MHTSAMTLRRGIRFVTPAAVAATMLLAVNPDGTAFAGPGKQITLPGTVEDFFAPGTPIGSLNEPIYPSFYCNGCHSFIDDGNPNEVVAPMQNWRSSMMAQAARDPVWHAALHVANTDVANSGVLCIRCHTPGGYMAGHAVPTDGSALVDDDFDGVTCNFCHRLVDQEASPQNPAADTPILQSLALQGLLPTTPGNAQFIVDVDDSRRGPLPFCSDPPPPDCPPNAVPANYHGSPIYYSPHHTESSLCGTCHDVSNAAFTRRKNGTYQVNTWGAAHPTGNPNDMMPEQRTYSEWANSTFATTGVYFADGRFGGAHPTGIMKSCQDCHMPKVYGGLCVFWDSDPFFPRPDIPQHGFAGANTWVIAAVMEQYGQGDTGLDESLVAMSQARVTQMMQAASDMQLAQLGNQLKVRLINYSGHKLPTGYPEGRRMWLNVKFYDVNNSLLAERGAYNFSDASLITADTKVYEMKLGMDSAVAAAANLPAGESFHLVLNNVVTKDNRIPPIGFTNAAFAAVASAPVAATYNDGQYWDDTAFAIPAGARKAVVTLYFQTSTREYMEFLRDHGAAAGLNAYNRWINQNKSTPVSMDMVTLNLAVPRVGDANHDGLVNIDDLVRVITQWGTCPIPNLCDGDVNGNGVIDIDDLVLVITNWG